MSNPSIEHYKYLDYLWGYILKTKDLELDLTLHNSSNYNQLEFSKSINLLGSSDSDWGGDLVSRKSTTGNIFLLQFKNSNYNIPISWLSKLQKTVALSSAEAEYMALKEATKESLYLQNFIKELITIIKDYNLINLFNSLNKIETDSLSAIELAKNPIYHARTKHVDIIYHFIRENLLNQKIDLIYKPTSILISNNLTKSTNDSKFNQFIKDINLKY